ncbi:phosphatase PAP2 family protein [Actomonas aquatica]|uniref:Phosphatase PAP2 family protein n=1 Tax=Actomonas aquatica TaxID=2866162 RepID=A0ABZ1C5G3_9BACT|nr:phosphatase PAP2 family protein [Opitutus sp. WL0086]WRQ86468.1 phosphatase PAP2 family protein [Opitutus sp. WL0086]
MPDATRSSWNLQRTLWPALVALAGVILLFEFTNLDLWVQDHFFDFATGQWWVDRRAPLPRAFFYNGPKYVIILLAVTLLTLLVGPARWRARWGLERKRIGAVLLTLALVPILIGQLKAHTNVFCPYEITRYGGDVAYVKAWAPHPPELQPERCGRCYPAGHASGGFALFALAGLGATAGWRRWGIGLGLGLGWMMGGYQMLKGAHYLSHTLVTMLVAWVMFLLIQRAFRLAPANGENE